MTKIVAEKCQYTIDILPKCCGECPFCVKYNYRDNAYYGIAYSCRLGYMEKGDTREFDVKRCKWPECRIDSDPRISTSRG